MVFFTLVAFTSQAIITQTHIHFGTRVAAISTTLALNGGLAKQPLPSKSPSDDDPTNCPICQGLAHAGSYVTPSLTAMMSLTVVAFVAAIRDEFFAIAQPHSHGWKSRAPPIV